MKAIRLRSRGKLGVYLEEIDAPTPSPGMARIRLLAASVNRVDIYMRDSGAGITHDLPQTMGVDGIGEVLDAPTGSGFAKGDLVVLYPYEFCGHCRYCRAGDQPLCVSARIFGEHRDGTFAEEISAPVSSLVALPRSVDLHSAAALGVAYLTAWRMVFGKISIGPGNVVLVQGAGGGVSYAAMQLAQMGGARVIVSTSGESKLEHFRSLGVEVIDYKNQDIAKRVLEMTKGEGADLVIDNVGEKTWASSLRSAARGGHLVTCGATTGAHPSADLQRLFIRQISVHGSTMASLDEFRRLVQAFTHGHLKPQIDSVFPLADVPAAFDRLEDPDRLGKIIIQIAEPSK